MRVHLCVVGRIRKGPERALIDDYSNRFNRTGRAMGLGPLTEHEVEDKKNIGQSAEALLLDRVCPAGAMRVMLDERGEQLSSPELAQRLAMWRDRGTHQDLALFIGGADGLDPSLRSTADAALSLGAMVWPHALARVMLCEQLYRASSILSGAPYHRA